jgi:hypothetical protein
MNCWRKGCDQLDRWIPVLNLWTGDEPDHRPTYRLHFATMKTCTACRDQLKAEDFTGTEEKWAVLEAGFAAAGWTLPDRDQVALTWEAIR